MVRLGAGRRKGLYLTTNQREQIFTWAAECLPEEACGLLAGRGRKVGRVIPVENALHSPVRFSMEPSAQLRAFLEMDAEGEDLVGIFHSHPAGPAEPSPTDLTEFFYPGAATLICVPEGGVWLLRAFWIEDGAAADIPLEFMP